jgi:hypothetical protein
MRSIATAITTNEPDAPDESASANGLGSETGQPLAGLNVEPDQGSSSQNEQKPEPRKDEAARVKRYKPLRRERTFMPVMSIEGAIARHAAMVEFTRKIMVRDQDFGEIPGAHKLTLLKPGAEKLCNFFGLEPEFTPVVEHIDWTGAQHGGETFCYARYRCRLLRHGRIPGAAEGSANSWESRYRYRWVPAEHVPEFFDRARMLKHGGRRTFCEFEFAIERAETTGLYGKPLEYWQKFKEAINAGTARRVERDTRQGKSPAWEFDSDTTLYRIPNTDVADLINTIQKMAQKRALVAATLIATSASEFFTQDVEDLSTDRGVFVTIAESSGVLQGAGGESIDSRMPPGKSVTSENSSSRKPWRNFGEMRKFFEQLREQVGETRYLEVLEGAGVTNPAQFRSPKQAMACYSRLVQIAAEQEVA